MSNMNGHVSRGFTIIEVVLFLSITALMVMGLMVGTTASVNRQRYNDAVTSLQTEVQALYSEVSSVANSRSSAVCRVVTNNGVSSIAITEADSADPSATQRGQSECILMGKALIIDGTKKQASSYDIVGAAPQVSATATEVATILNAYPTVYKSSRNTTALQWETSIYAGAEDASGAVETYQRGVAIYVVRAPISGAIYTYAAVMAPNAFSWQDSSATTWRIVGSGGANPTEVFAADKQRAVQVGVDPCGLVSTNTSMKLRIAPQASGTSAITLTPQTGTIAPYLGGC